MGERNFLIVGSSSAIVISQGDPEQAVTISDEQVIAELREVIEQRRELGLQLSRRLKAGGFMPTDDEATVMVMVFPRGDTEPEIETD
jgi:hypothetical protein